MPIVVWPFFVEGGAPLAKLVQITIIVYDTQIAIFRWGYKPTYNWGGPSCGESWEYKLGDVHLGICGFGT